MRNFLKIVSFFVLLVIQFDLSAQVTGILASGNWYKFSVANDGAVKIDYNLLKRAGINPDQIDPRNIKIYTGQHGMLPQANDQPRISQLQEISIEVSGESDGRFNSGDLILFFGRGPDKYEYDLQKQLFAYQNNLFTDKNFYFLTIGSDAGKRITKIENLIGAFPLINQFDEIAYYETEKYNILKSGRQWFGEQFDAITTATIQFDISGVVENSDIKLVSHVMAQSITNTSFQISFNANPVLIQPIVAIPNSSYNIKGRVKADTTIFNSNTVAAPTKSKQDINYQFTKGSPGISIGYLDFFILSLKRKLALYGDETIFRSSSSLANTTSTFEVNNVTAGVRLWDVTDYLDAKDQDYSLTNNKLLFSTNTTLLKEFVVFKSDKAKDPVFEGKVSNQNIHSMTHPELLIITHPDFLNEAQRLANHRQSISGVISKVVTINQIYNEFSGGKQDVTALRDFIKMLYDDTNVQLKNVLIFGRGSYDYKNRVLGNTNYVPIYESRNSLSPLETYASDDYYSFLETTEGEWSESPAQNHTLDIGVGRLPVKTLAEATRVVDKLIEYDLDPSSFGPWQNEILFVADDGDFNIHNSQADQLANSVELLNPKYHTKKFFLDSFEQVTKPTGQRSPDATKALDLAIHKGSLIVNYTGHGSERVWMDERILDETIIENWKNGPRYPLFVTATCEFGRHDDPFQITSGELTLLQKKGGSIGLVTSSRPVNSSTNFTLNKAFYESLFTKSQNKFNDLGTVFKETKNKSISGVANRNFSLLGDPSMQLALAENEIIFDEIKTSAGSLELKGLSQVNVTGHIENNLSVQTQFIGNLTLTLFSEEVNLVTKGDENPPFNYSDRPNTLFRGNTSVNQGLFELQFIMPKNIPAEFITGKFLTSAFDKDGDFANGAALNNQMGGLEPSPIPDNTPPQIQLFLGDTTFIPGGIVGPNTKIVAKFFDESGINISVDPTGNEITASIDSGSTFSLNEYYYANLNNYKTGSLTFPLERLEKGKHTLTLSASDTYNNRAIGTVDFVVTDGDQIQIEEFSNYPNPFYESTILEFTQTRPGEDLEVYLTILDLAGKVILNQTFEVFSSQYRVTLTEWDGKSASGTKLSQGIYLGKLSVRSLLDGSKNEQYTKLIILN
ncbi:MAG: type IX secretion system sortase PorU [Cyclobacteriaceae bacterium]|nr:type IX secretion system sortase PorU [Cyclobacteriaceae bacterium]